MDQSPPAALATCSPRPLTYLSAGTTPAARPSWQRTFAATPAHIGQAREFLATLLDGHPAADEAVLCLSELVTNAVLHSASARPGGTFQVSVCLRAGMLRVEVEDGGGPWRTATTGDVLGGRGLIIVDSLVRNWGIIEPGPPWARNPQLWLLRRARTANYDGERRPRPASSQASRTGTGGRCLAWLRVAALSVAELGHQAQQ
jgi:serine/threonine-protein kinase RsbW